MAVNPELAHLQYVQQSSHMGSVGQPSNDGGFGGLGGDNEDISSERDGGLKLWEGKYLFQEDMLPSFVGEAFGRKVCLLSRAELELQCPFGTKAGTD